MVSSSHLARTWLYQSAFPPDHREPRLRPALAERDVLQVGADLEPGRPDLLDVPAVGERFPDLPLGDPPRPLRAGLLVAEAEQEEPPARLGHMGQPGDVAGPILVVEDVEQAAVDHAVELAVEVRQRQGVHQEELGVQAPLLRPSAWPPGSGLRGSRCPGPDGPARRRTGRSRPCRSPRRGPRPSPGRRPRRTPAAACRCPRGACRRRSTRRSLRSGRRS